MNTALLSMPPRVRAGRALVAVFRPGNQTSAATFTRSTTATYTASVADLVTVYRPGDATSAATIARTTTATYTLSV